MGRLQNQCQEDVRRNLHFPQGVDERIALLAPKVPLVARHEVIKFEQNRLPVPEPSSTNGEDYGWNGKPPNEEVHPNVPARVNWAPMAMSECEKEDDRIVEEHEEDLQETRLAES